MIRYTSLLIILTAISLFANNPDTPYGVQYYYAGGEINLFWFYHDVNKLTINNNAKNLGMPYMVNELENDARVVTLIADYQRDLPLQSIEIYIWGGDLFPGGGNQESEFAVSLYSQFPLDTNINPVWGEIISHAQDVPPNGKWHEISVHEYLHYDTLYFQFRWLEGTPTAPMIMLDTDTIGDLSYSGYYVDDELLFYPLYEGELLIRLNYNEPDTSQPISGTIPDSFSVFSDYDSSVVLSKTDSEIDIGDSLHLSLSPENANNFLSIAAWNNNQLSERSTPLLLFLHAESFPLISDPEILSAYTEVNKTSQHHIEISNPLAEVIDLDISVLESCEWLNLNRSSFLIQADSSITLEVTINNYDLEIGTYQCELMLQCFSENNLYKPALYLIENNVDATTAVWDNPLPENYQIQISQNYPNPFNNSTVIYSTSKSPLNIYNLKGQLVISLTPISLQSGNYLFQWNGSLLNGKTTASGIYFYSQKDISMSRKMLLLK